MRSQAIRMDVTSFKRNASLERVVPWTVLQIKKKTERKKNVIVAAFGDRVSSLFGH